jgi:hypothetical protein
VVIGQRRSVQGAEAWLHQAGISVECLEDPACEALLEQRSRKAWRIAKSCCAKLLG